MQKLTTAGDAAVALLRDRLNPAASFDERAVAPLLTRLDSDEFGVREKATAELAALGPRTWPALRRALAGQLSDEVRARIDRAMTDRPRIGLTADEIRAVRAVEVCERIATPEATAMLEALAKGAGDSFVTYCAEVTLDRLGKRRVQWP